MSLTPEAGERHSTGASRQGAPVQSASGVAQEIAIVRELILRITEMAEQETTLPELRRVLDSLSSASTRLVRLLQAQMDLQDNREHASALQEALAEMLRKFDDPQRSGH